MFIYWSFMGRQSFLHVSRTEEEAECHIAKLRREGRRVTTYRNPF